MVQGLKRFYEVCDSLRDPQLLVMDLRILHRLFCDIMAARF